MRRRGLLWHLLPTYLVVALVSVLSVAWYSSVWLRSEYEARAAVDLEARALLLAETFQESVTEPGNPAVDRIVRELGVSAEARITVIAPSGRVLADSDRDAAAMDNHADRPEVIEALSGEIGQSRRHSFTLGQELLYVAVPVRQGGDVVGVVRTSIPTSRIEEGLRPFRNRTILMAVLLTCLALAISAAATRAIVRPVDEMRRGALRFAHGGFGYRLAPPRSEELASLAEALNAMARDLGERIAEITRSRAEQDAVLESMVEGVIAFDPDERLITLNHAAAEVFGVEADDIKGRSLQEIIRNTDIHRFAAMSLSGEKPIESDIVIRGVNERHLQAHGTALVDGEGNRIGAVVVVNDVTRIRRLENVRRDFVANFSHELRTPITSIKGFVETLLDGATQSPEEAARFLRIVAKHVDRLNATIEDLLYLSRIEQDSTDSEIVLELRPVEPVLRTAVDACSIRAAGKSIDVILSCDEGLTARINPQLFEHAVVNLLDNAIKYSESGKSVLVEGTETDDSVVIRVHDQGVGIDAEHLPRIFERFYRVDKARSRELGGTGLGLALAKHIAQAHGGSIGVESTPGVGSIFSISLPRAS